MSKVRDLHHEAMRIADDAHILRHFGDTVAATRRFAEAAELERQAFELLPAPPESEPTWTIIAISVSSLYLKAGNFEKARLYASKVLTDPGARPSNYHRDMAAEIIADCEKGEVTECR